MGSSFLFSLSFPFLLSSLLSFSLLPPLFLLSFSSVSPLFRLEFIRISILKWPIGQLSNDQHRSQKWHQLGSNPGPLVLEAKSLPTRPSMLVVFQSRSLS